MCWSRGQEPRNWSTPERQSSGLYTQEVSENEQFNLLLPREQTRETNPPGHWPPPPPLLYLWCQASSPAAGRERRPGMLGAAVLAPHQTLHLSLLSSAQGLREPWGGQDAEGSSLIDDRQGVRDEPVDGEGGGGKERRSCPLTKLNLHQCWGEGREEGMICQKIKTGTN